MTDGPVPDASAGSPDRESGPNHLDGDAAARIRHSMFRTSAGNGAEAGRTWRTMFLSPAGDGNTRRRGSDIIRLALAFGLFVLCWIVVGSGINLDRSFVNAISPPPNGLRWVVDVLFWMGSAGMGTLLLLLMLLDRRWGVLRDLVLALAGSTALVYLIRLWLGPDGGFRFEAQYPGRDLHFPGLAVALTMAAISSTRPYLSRSWQRIGTALVVVVAVATVVQGSGLPVGVLAGISVGWISTAGVHLIFGSPLGLPSAADVTALLADISLVATDVTAAEDQEWGVARFTGRIEGAPIDIDVYGRDAADTQILAKALRFLFYRDSGPTLSLTRRQEVEHQAYLNLMAHRANANVPEVLVAGPVGPTHDALFVTLTPPGHPLVPLEIPSPGEALEAEKHPETTNEKDTTAKVEASAATVTSAPTGTPAEVVPARSSLSDQAVVAVLTQVQRLHDAGIAHGSLGLKEIRVADDDSVTLVDFRRGINMAPSDALSSDLASVLATLNIVAGPDRTVAAARQVLSDGELQASLAFMQRAALNPAAARDQRSRRSALGELRTRCAESLGVEVPKLVEPRRVGWGTALMALGSVVGGWALLGVLLNVTKSWHTITGANWAWVALVFVVAQMSFPSIAITTVGSVTDPISYGRAVLLEVANIFVGLAGGTVACIATRVRFFQKQGVNATVAISSGVLVSTASWIVKGGLFLVALPFALGNLHFKTNPDSGTGSSHGGLIWFVLAVVVVVGLLLGLLLAVPRWRRLASAKVRPKASETWSHLKTLATHPKNLVEIFGGNIAAQLATALALGASLHAFGEHLGLATIIVVLTLGSMLGGISPVPGGMGVVEAGMILGLTAAGVSESVAVASVFVQRLFTAYLPPIWGWFTLVWMRKKEYL